MGIGGRGGLRAAALPVVRAALESRAVVVSVDLPSGVDADTGQVAGEAVRADVTVTFGVYKPGLLVDPGREYAGAVRLVDIGLELGRGEGDLEALQHGDVARLLPEPTGESDKYRRGVVGIVAGSARYPGAAVLAVAGALRGGAGAVRYVGPAAGAVVSRFPETLVSEGAPGKAGRVQAWVAGPGLGDDASGLADVLGAEVPVLIDADGLRLADPEAVRGRAAPTLLTPHAGEAAALLGVAREEVEAERLAAVRELADRFSATVLLKGSTTLVAGGRGRVPSVWLGSIPRVPPGWPPRGVVTCCPGFAGRCSLRGSERSTPGPWGPTCMGLLLGVCLVGRLSLLRMWLVGLLGPGGMFGTGCRAVGSCVAPWGRFAVFGAGPPRDVRARCSMGRPPPAKRP